MKRECYHCKATITVGEPHDCWTTTEEKLTADLPEDLIDAWYRLREAAMSFGEQRVYASHKSIMFARTNCYFFVRPKKNNLEVIFFLGREVRHPMIKKAEASSKLKTWHLVSITHRDEVEAPLTDWLKEAYEVTETLRSLPKQRAAGKKKSAPTQSSKSKRSLKVSKSSRKASKRQVPARRRR